MKCEICKTIEKLGLDPATHDPWMCADSKSPRLVLEAKRNEADALVYEPAGILPPGLERRANAVPEMMNRDLCFLQHQAG